MSEAPVNEGIYTGFAPGYDLVMKDVDYTAWAAYILDLLAHYSLKGKRILNLACGTGTTEMEWLTAGYQIVGIDQSEQMIQAAIRKNPPHKHLRFAVGDMRDIHLDETFDHVCCLYDSLNYLTRPADVISCFQAVAAHLEPGGAFIFDVATECNILENFTNITYAENFDDFAYIWENEYNIRTKICRSDFFFFSREPDGEAFRRSHETHFQRIYTTREILRWLKDTGFEHLGSFDGFTLNPPSPQSERIHFVARRLRKI
ncbi:MAG: Trans-aconitate 2-methyltransferase [bacterium]|nr:methyltransferase domain-containing protein [Candidatus Omnitrophota bacterium]MBV6482700.1 Trans-aconitate 2-methyltransferase [bacterium]